MCSVGKYTSQLANGKHPILSFLNLKEDFFLQKISWMRARNILKMSNGTLIYKKHKACGLNIVYCIHW